MGYTCRRALLLTLPDLVLAFPQIASSRPRVKSFVLFVHLFLRYLAAVSLMWYVCPMRILCLQRDFKWWYDFVRWLLMYLQPAAVMRNARPHLAHVLDPHAECPLPFAHVFLAHVLDPHVKCSSPYEPHAWRARHELGMIRHDQPRRSVATVCLSTKRKASLRRMVQRCKDLLSKMKARL